MDIVNQKVEALNKYAVKIPPIVQLAEKTQQKPGLILAVALLITGLVILISLGATILTVIITVVYPAIKSIKALETRGEDEDDKEWLTYWCVFGVFTLVDEFAGFILSYIPFFFFIRLGFFVWLMAPQTKGASVIYNKVLKPQLEKHRPQIEKFINDVKSSGTTIMKEAGKAAME